MFTIIILIESIVSYSNIPRSFRLPTSPRALDGAGQTRAEPWLGAWAREHILISETSYTIHLQLSLPCPAPICPVNGMRLGKI